MKDANRTRSVHPHQLIQVEIDGLGHRGEGVGRFDGLTIFIPGGAPGDTLEARVTTVKQSFARAELVRVLEPSPDRVAPPCPVFGTCGGCQLQHIAYPAQLTLKRQQVVDALERIGKLPDVPVRPALGMQDPWHYRNKAQYPFGWRDGRIIAGFFEAGTHRIVDIERCDIQHRLGNRIMLEVKDLARTYGVRIYDEKRHKGVLRHVLARVGRGTEESMAVLVTNGPDFPAGEQIARELMQRIPELVSVVQNINPARTNTVLGSENRILAGRESITDFIKDLQFTISPVSFFQVNPRQTEVLYDTALSFAELTGTETVLDLYCGIGTIALFLARQAGEVIGVEVVQDAIDDARRNAARNGITNTRFICADAAEIMPRLAREGTRIDVIVVDPPRKGCAEPVLHSMAGIGPERIVYVSCNPASLARDLKILADLGYRTVKVQPVDMFPHTSHVESCALIVKETR